MDKKNKIIKVEKMSKEELQKNKILFAYHSLCALGFVVASLCMTYISIKDEIQYGIYMAILMAVCSKVAVNQSKKYNNKLKDSGYSFKLKK